MTTKNPSEESLELSQELSKLIMDRKINPIISLAAFGQCWFNNCMYAGILPKTFKKMAAHLCKHYEEDWQEENNDI